MNNVHFNDPYYRVDDPEENPSVLFPILFVLVSLILIFVK